MGIFRKSFCTLLIFAFVLVWTPSLAYAEESNAPDVDVVLELNQAVQVNPDLEEIICFSFTAPETAEYCFYTDEAGGMLREGPDVYSYDLTYSGCFFDLEQGETKLFYFSEYEYLEETDTTYTVHMVKSTPIERLELHASRTLYVGNTENLRYTMKKFPLYATQEELEWTSSNSQVATVDSSGCITAIAAGTVDITVSTANGVKDTATITIKEDGNYDVISLGEKKTVSLGYGDQYRFSFTPEKDGTYVFYMPRGKITEVGQKADGTAITYSESFQLSIRNGEEVIADSSYMVVNYGVSKS